MFGRKRKSTSKKRKKPAPRSKASSARAPRPVKPKRGTPARKPKPKQPSRLGIWWRDLEPDRRRRIKVRGGWCVAALVMVLAGMLALRAADRRIRGQLTAIPTRSFSVEFTERPQWMPDRLANGIARSVVPPDANYFDEQLARNVRRRAQANPWVAQVRLVRKEWIRRPDEARLTLDVKFRKPVARLNVAGRYVYVDAQGVRLPTEDVPSYEADIRCSDGQVRRFWFTSRYEAPAGVTLRRIHYPEIHGADAPAPPEGVAWGSASHMDAIGPAAQASVSGGRDVLDALRLIALLKDRPWRDEITVVDVRNHGERISRTEPELRMYASRGPEGVTDIRFGGFPQPGGDYVVSPERKLSYLDSYYQDHGRLAGKRYLDLRHDHLYVSLN